MLIQSTCQFFRTMWNSFVTLRFIYAITHFDAKSGPKMPAGILKEIFLTFPMVLKNRKDACVYHPHFRKKVRSKFYNAPNVNLTNSCLRQNGGLGEMTARIRKNYGDAPSLDWVINQKILHRIHNSFLFMGSNFLVENPVKKIYLL